MTNDDFDNTRFQQGDEIVVRRYFGKATEEIEYINFADRRINGYTPSEIMEVHQKQVQ